MCGRPVQYSAVQINKPSIHISNHVLVEATGLLEETSKDHVTDLDYGDALERSILLGPAPLRRFSTASKYALNILIVFAQMALCSVYVLFVADHIMVK